jgi:hypothetical protein
MKKSKLSFTVDEVVTIVFIIFVLVAMAIQCVLLGK